MPVELTREEVELLTKALTYVDYSSDVSAKTAKGIMDKLGVPTRVVYYDGVTKVMTEEAARSAYPA